MEMVRTAKSWPRKNQWEHRDWVCHIIKRVTGLGQTEKSLSFFASKMLKRRQKCVRFENREHWVMKQRKQQIPVGACVSEKRGLQWFHIAFWKPRSPTKKCFDRSTLVKLWREHWQMSWIEALPLNGCDLLSFSPSELSKSRFTLPAFLASNRCCNSCTLGSAFTSGFFFFCWSWSLSDAWNQKICFVFFLQK